MKNGRCKKALIIFWIFTVIEFGAMFTSVAVMVVLWPGPSKFWLESGEPIVNYVHRLSEIVFFMALFPGLLVWWFTKYNAFDIEYGN